MAQTQISTRVKVDNQGRLIIPAEIRHELGIEPGTVLTLTVSDGEMRLITFEQAVRRIQALARKYTGGRTGLVDEFIAERRREAERE